MKFKLKDIKPNPFRQTEFVWPAKVETLKESIDTTGWWDNVVCRVVDGEPQLAYGHHRLAALRGLFPPNHEVELIVKKLDDYSMIQILARENAEDFFNDAFGVMMSVKATVFALAAGKIPEDKMPSPDPKTNKAILRYAPSFIAGQEPCGSAPDPHPYTADSVALFLGMTKKRGEGKRATDAVCTVLDALELIEQKWAGLTENNLLGHTTNKIGPFIAEQKRLREEHEVNLRRIKEAQDEADRFRKEQEELAQKAREARVRAAAAKKADDEKEEARARAEQERLEKKQEVAADKQTTYEETVEKETENAKAGLAVVKKATAEVLSGLKAGTVTAQTTVDAFKQAIPVVRSASAVVAEQEYKRPTSAVNHVSPAVQELRSLLEIWADTMKEVKAVEAQICKCEIKAEKLLDRTDLTEAQRDHAKKTAAEIKKCAQALSKAF